jgi:hypothetical protein
MSSSSYPVESGVCNNVEIIETNIQMSDVIAAEDFALNDENLNTYKMKLNEIVENAFLAGAAWQRGQSK